MSKTLDHGEGAARGSGGVHRPALHPLEPLTPDEISRAAAVLVRDRGLGDDHRFVFTELHEPPKDIVNAFRAGDTWSRQAFIVLRDSAHHRTLEAVVDLSADRVAGFEEIPDAQAPMTKYELANCKAVIAADPRWQEAMRKRGVTDLSLVTIDKWASGYTGPQDAPDRRRIARPLTYVKESPLGNAYARPVENLVVTVDLDAMEVLDVTDTGVVALPPTRGDYRPDQIVDPRNTPSFESVREPMKPIVIEQPQGRSFTIDDHALSWANWRLRIGYTPREGLVLHQISYVDRGRERPVIYRASLSEMYVPYGDPGDTHWNKNVFDEGEYGLGGMANSLVLGCDCLGDIAYLDAYVNDHHGQPVRIPNAICIHEEDAGIGWKHTDTDGTGLVRRNRRLVISVFTTVGNYDYGFYWYLYLDGTIEFESKLTGVLSTGAVEAGVTPEYGALVAPGLYGPNHQHFFGLRLDMAVDGERNDFYSVHSEAAPDEANPWGNAWRQVVTHLDSEHAARQLADPAAGKAWLVANADRRNALGSLIAYKVELGGSLTMPFARPGSQQANRGGFTTRHIWATAYDPRERYAAGEYVAQNPGGDGLPAYTGGDRPLAGADLVIWPVLCAHHVVRPEDWPVMPVATVGLHLKPVGFFDGNPMLDLPAEGGHTGHGEGAACHGDCGCCSTG
ncbi:primary-amine oxidase [Sinosporangium album]|uniref:Amine oxidase n=1 Tax=Sinosporangium album TaxID=504805 RepID=A0A1G7ZPM5_9ACTN|nr:primary-amine oxidase [Sinosporangium album]SDH10527.1 primary-amine oxidase [Sinosporangium album]